MSAFLVSMLTINSIVAAIRSLLNPSEIPRIANLFADAGIDTTQKNWEETLAKAMFALNEQSLQQRYGDPITGNFTYSRVQQLPSLYQTLKSINCWLYQCSEGNVPESKLFRLFQTVILDRVTEAIVYRSPEYEQAEWG